VGALVSTFPWLIPLSQNKEWIFLGAGLVLLVNGFFIFRTKIYRQCNFKVGEGYKEVDKWTKRIFWISVTLYTIGAFVAFALVPLMGLIIIYCLT